MKKEELEKRVKELSSVEWNHWFELPHGVKTRSGHINSPGYCLNKWSRLKPVLTKIGLEGKTVLDLGCADGYFSFECLKLGAKSAFGFDVDPLRIERANFVKEVLEIKNVDFEVVDMYDLSPDKPFDVTLCLGFLHRIPDMEKALDKLSQITNTIVSEFKTLDSEESTKKFHGQTKLNKFNTLHYTPTKKYVINYMEKIGFTKNEVVEDVKSGLNYKRTILVSSK